MKSPLLDKEEQLETYDYTDDESFYRGAILKRLEEARTARDSQLLEFDQMDYLTYFDMNEKLANSFVGAKVNKSDSNFQSGTVRNKLMAFLSAINRMNLSPDVMAFGSGNTMLGELGNAITEVLRKTEELENDDEKRLLRQYELMKQGTVFVEDIWRKSYKKVKTSNKNADPTKITWTEKVDEVMSRPNRTILDNRGVYLGSMSTFEMSDQPYAFTVDVIPYELAKSIYGKFPRWKYVSKKLSKVDTDTYGTNWRLTSVDDNYVEVVKYQDKPNDEFQLILSGVMMLPVGYPLSEVSCNGEYTFVKQIFKLIRHNFPYGKSLCMELRNQVGVYDEMLKMAVYKTQKSFAPIYLNNSGQVLKTPMPGQMLMGVKPNSITRLDERDAGVTSAEVAVIDMISQRIDESSVNKSYQGGEAPGTTLGEAQLAQQQSSMIVDLAMFSCGLLEKKLGEIRVPMLLKYWFEPIDSKLDEVRSVLTKVYRVSNIEASIPGKGMGRSMVVPMEGQLPGSKQVYDEQEASKEPVRKYYVNPEEIKKAEYIWQVVVNPTPRRGDAQQKLMFNTMMQAAMSLGLQPDPQYTRELFSETYSVNVSKMFPEAPMMPGAMPGQPGQTPQAVPQVNKVPINPNA